jgi:hypothetical protein
MASILPYNPVYYTSKGYRWLIYVLAPPLTLLFLAMPVLLHADSKGQPTPILLWAFMSVIGIGMGIFFLYGLVETARWHFVIEPAGLRQAGAFQTKTLAFEDIKGFRRDDKYLSVYSKTPGRPKLKVGHTTERYDELTAWLAAHFPDLNQADTEAQLTTALTREDLGRTPEERQLQLEQARRTALVLNVAGGLAAAWLLLHPQPYQWAVAAGLLVPLLAAGALWWHQGTLQLAEAKNSPYPSVLVALGAPALVLVLRTLFDVEFVDYGQVWPLVAQLGLAYGLLLALGARSWLFGRGTALNTGPTLLVLAFLYGYGAGTMFDTAFDEAPGRRYPAQVLSKHLSRGKTTTYYLHLTPWGPIHTAQDVTVDAGLYDYVEPGSPVHVYLYPGRLGAAWFTTTR